MAKFSSLFRRKRPFGLADQNASSWLRRADDAASLVDLIPDLAQPFCVVDLGAGDKKLARALAKKYRVNYVGYDKHPQSADIRLWDASDGTVPDAGDMMFALGLLEYLEAPQMLLGNVARASRFFVCSYVTSDAGRYNHERLAKLGWKTHYSVAEVEKLLVSTGLRVVRRIDNIDDSYSIWLTAAPS